MAENSENNAVDTTLESAGRALDDFANGPVTEATQSIEKAVGKSFDAVSRTIARAAASGRMSINGMVSAILADFERVALSQFITKPVQNLIGSFADLLLSGAGARALGGPVSSGVPYLVGERGPEMFVPATNGTIAATPAAQSPRPQIVLNVTTPDAQSFARSEPQLAALMARALARGQRNL
jgi:phage-related minor tail protein